MGAAQPDDDRLAAGIVVLVLGGLVVLGAAFIGLSPIAVEGHSCGSTWIRNDKAYDCYRYYDWTMLISVVALLIGLGLCAVGVAFLRRRRINSSGASTKEGV